MKINISEEIRNFISSNGPVSADKIVTHIQTKFGRTIPTIRTTIHQLVYKKEIVSAPNTDSGAHRSTRVYSMAKRTPVKVVAEQLIQAPVQSQEIVQPVQSQEIVQPVQAQLVVDFNLSELVDSIAVSISNALSPVLKVRLAAVVESEIKSVMGAIPDQLATSVAIAKEQPKVYKKPQIVIVGLLPNQVQMIHNEFKNELALEFVAADHALGHRMKSLCVSSEAILIMTGFISHSVEDIIKSRNGNLIRVSGGMSTLRTELTRIYLRHVDKSAA